MKPLDGILKEEVKNGITRCRKVKSSPFKATKTRRVGRGIALPYLRPRH